MLYVFSGDRFMARDASKALADACKKKRSGSEYIFFSSDTGGQSLEELLLGQGLFERKCIVFCDEILCEDKGKHLVDNLEMYNSSDHMFIIFEPNLDSKQEKKLEKIGAVMKKHKKAEKVEDARPLFLFADIFVKKNKNKTLAVAHNLLHSGHNPESIINILLWKLKTVAIFSKAKNVAESGLKPFVYSRAKEASKTFKDPVDTFVKAETIIREGRMGGISDEEILDRIILNS